MKLKLSELQLADLPLQRLSQVPLPGEDKFRLARAIRLIRPELETFYEQRNEIVRRLGEQREDGEYEVQVGSKNWPEFAAEVGQLLAVEVELDIDQIRRAPLMDDKVSISADDLLNLEFLLQEEEPAGAARRRKPKPKRTQ